MLCQTFLITYDRGLVKLYSNYLFQVKVKFLIQPFFLFELFFLILIASVFVKSPKYSFYLILSFHIN